MNAEDLRQRLPEPANAKWLLLESGILTEDLARFRRWWRDLWDCGVNLDRPETFFEVRDVEANAPVPLAVGWATRPVVVDVVADAIINIEWRRPKKRPGSFAESLHLGSFRGLLRVFIRIEADLQAPAQTIATIKLLADQGLRPWLVLTESPFWATHAPEFRAAGAVLWRVPHPMPAGTERG